MSNCSRIQCYLYFYDEFQEDHLDRPTIRRNGEEDFEVSELTKLEALFSLKNEIEFMIDKEAEDSTDEHILLLWPYL